MNSETSFPSKQLVKCCSCGCNCSLINGFSKDWVRSAKRKFNELEDHYRLVISGFDYPAIARVQIENECEALRKTVGTQQKSMQSLYSELEKERNASSSAANEAMSMILRLQRDKAEVQMEARQFKLFAEEKMAHDQEELLLLEDLICKREQVIQSLICEIEAYKHRMLRYGFTEDQFMLDDAQLEFPMYDYPSLKCNLHRAQGSSDMENDVEDVDKYALGETPRAQDHLKNLDFRISQMERSHSNNHFDKDFSVAKNIIEKVIVGQSPKQTKHSRRFSTDSSCSPLGFPSDYFHPDINTESPKTGTSFMKTEYVSQMEDFSTPRKLDNNGSEIGDDTRVYTIDAIHEGVSYNDFSTTPRESLEIKKLYMRLQALEADRESMKQAIISMGTDKSQFMLLKEIAQQFCNEVPPERRMPVGKPSFFGRFSFMSIIKWTISLVFWRSKEYRNNTRYMFGLSANDVGLLILLDRGHRVRHWRCLKSTQV